MEDSVISLNLCHNSDHDALEDVVRLCHEHGCGIELSDYTRISVLDDDSRTDWIYALIRAVPDRALHAPYLHLDPVSLDAGIRKQTRDAYERAYHIALRLGVRHITYHSIYDPAQYSFDHWFNGLVIFWRDFLAEKNTGMRVHIENVLDKDPQVLLELLEAIGRSDLDINLDIGHAHAYSGMPVIEWFDTLGEKIGYVHLHDNDGVNDHHIGLGQGTIPLMRVFESLKEMSPDAVCSIESGGIGMTQSLDWLREHGIR